MILEKDKRTIKLDNDVQISAYLNSGWSEKKTPQPKNKEEKVNAKARGGSS